MRWITAIVVWMLLVTAVRAVPPEAVPEFLQTVSVTVKAGSVSGCGTIRVVDIDGEPCCFVLTAKHVVERQRKMREIIDSEGGKRHRVTYDDVEIIRAIRDDDGTEVGESRLDTKIIRVSDEVDVAVLQIKKQHYTEASIEFCLDRTPPRLGTPVLHCGSPGGHDLGGHSITEGIISQIGRVIDGDVYLQTDASCIGGSSGGSLVMKENGELLGVVVASISSGDSFTYCVSTRRILKWAEETGMMWLFDPAVTIDAKQLRRLPVEDGDMVFEKKAGSDEPTVDSPSSADKEELRPLIRVRP